MLHNNSNVFCRHCQWRVLEQTSGKTEGRKTLLDSSILFVDSSRERLSIISSKMAWTATFGLGSFLKYLTTDTPSNFRKASNGNSEISECDKKSLAIFWNLRAEIKQRALDFSAHFFWNLSQAYKCEAKH